jgi:transposase
MTEILKNWQRMASRADSYSRLLTRRGNHRLKNALFLPAFAAIRTGESKTFYDRKRAEGKRHNAAVICLARRRCDVILAMLRTSSEYVDPTLEESEKAA